MTETVRRGGIEIGVSSPASSPEVRNAVEVSSLDAALPGASAGPRPNEVREKARIRIRKFGGMRFISHNDLLRAIGRMIRRSGLKVRYSQGFHPMPRIAIPLALPLGVVGEDEAIEIEFEESISAERVAAALHEVAPPGIEILRVEMIPASRKAVVSFVEYCCDLPEEIDIDEVALRLQRLMTATEWRLTRATPGKPDRQVDLRRWLRSGTLQGRRLSLTVGVDNGTTARPDELLDALGLGSLAALGAVLVRNRVVLADEAAACEAFKR